MVVVFVDGATDWTCNCICIRNGAAMSSDVRSNEVITGSAPKATILVSFDVRLNGPPAPLAQGKANLSWCDDNGLRKEIKKHVKTCATAGSKLVPL